MVTGHVAYVQCALLYTNSNGERRIRCARGVGAAPAAGCMLFFSHAAPRAAAASRCCCCSNTHVTFCVYPGFTLWCCRSPPSWARCASNNLLLELSHTHTHTHQGAHHGAADYRRAGRDVPRRGRRRLRGAAGQAGGGEGADEQAGGDAAGAAGACVCGVVLPRRVSFYMCCVPGGAVFQWQDIDT